MIAITLAACSSDNNGNPTTPKHAEITSFSVGANDNSVLSAVAAVTTTDADSAHVVYWTGSDATQSTPYVSDLSGGHITVLGLQPATEYNFFVEAFGGGATATSDTVTMTTGALPTFLQSASLTSTAPASFGYI
ncbi:MAG: fibronectin type III domain-containing protein, partial [Gemmatimonadaceae bacterium]